jgi:chromosome segregation ATPase
MTGGLAMDRPGLRLTPENEIEQLGLRRLELARQIAELEDIARRNDIATGALVRASPDAMPVAPRTRQALTPQEIQELEKRRELLEAQLADEKAHLGTAEEELQLAERDDALHRQQFYSNPNYASDDKGKAQLQALSNEVAARRAEVSAAQASVEALEEELRTLERALGPEPARLLTPEEQREAWQKRLQPLRDELARAELELERMQAQAAAQGLTLYPETSTGSPTSALLRRLETRAAELRQQIASLEDEARRAGVPPGWVR